MELHRERMIYSAVLELRATCEGSIPATNGHGVHAAFIEIMRQADRDLAEVLHRSGVKNRPFTVSSLLGVPKALKGKVAISPKKSYFLRFTFLQDPIYHRFMDHFIWESRIKLLGNEFIVMKVLTTPGSLGHSSWAGYSSFERLLQEAEPDEEITLDFTSPTAFYSPPARPWGKRFDPFPEPTLVFRSLLKKWNAFSPIKMDEALLKYVEGDVVVKQYKIETRNLRYPRHLQTGFIGRCTYALMGEENEEEKHKLNTLADFAFYGGVGYHTTMGMGQVRRV
jgi:CRISPR-associated endoribonuclease Cas6